MAEVLQFPAIPPAEPDQAPAEGKKLLKQSKLTELRIERLPVTGTTTYTHDGAQPGLSVRVSARGTKAFVFTKHKDGKLTRITLGRVGALRLEAARRAAQELHGDISRGVDVVERRRSARQRDAASETLKEAFERFMDAKARRPSTVTDYEFLWRRYVPAVLKRKAVQDVTPADIEAAKRALSKHPRTANKMVALIGAIMAKSGRWAHNPTRGVSRHQEHPRTRRLTVDELQRVWAACEGEPEWGDFFKLLILTGARRSPFQMMRWRDLDLDAGVWTVQAAWSKNKRELAVPLSIEALRILKARREALTHEGNAALWVFPSADSTTGHIVNPEKPWRRLLKAAGVLEHTSLHDVRRTLGSRLAVSGVAGATISNILGHLSSQSLKHYVHLDVSAGSEAIDQLYENVIKPPPK